MLSLRCAGRALSASIGIVSLSLARIFGFDHQLPEEITGGSFVLQLAPSIRAELYFIMPFMCWPWPHPVAVCSATGKAARHRDDADAAEMMGVNVPIVRLYGWLIAAFFPAVCGGVEAWYTNVVDTETAFNTLITAKTVIYAVAGGLGTVTGPVLGAVAMVWLDELIWRQFPLLNLLILGLATIILVLFLPRGIVGTLLRKKPQWRRYIP